MEGIKVKILEPNEFLYRANKNTNKNNKFKYVAKNTKSKILASNNYKDAEVKYFTLSENESRAYTKKGKSYIKSWKPHYINKTNEKDKIILVDILDLPTRIKLEEYFTNNEKTIFKNAFPIVNGKVSRNSQSTKDDNIILKKICSLGKYDGYYMKTIPSFHSEVGLCKEALKKIELINNPKIISEAPNINPSKNKTRKRPRTINYNNAPLAKQLF